MHIRPIHSRVCACVPGLSRSFLSGPSSTELCGCSAMQISKEQKSMQVENELHAVTYVPIVQQFRNNRHTKRPASSSLATAVRKSGIWNETGNVNESVTESGKGRGFETLLGPSLVYKPSLPVENHHDSVQDRTWCNMYLMRTELAVVQIPQCPFEVIIARVFHYTRPIIVHVSKDHISG